MESLCQEVKEVKEMEVMKTLAVKLGDPFFVDVPTSKNELVMHGKQDSPRVNFLKNILAVLIEKISTKDVDATVKTLSVELEKMLMLFREIFGGHNKAEMNVLKFSLRKLGFSGKGRLLMTIEDSHEISEDQKKLMKRMVLEEAP